MHESEEISKKMPNDNEYLRLDMCVLDPLLIADTFSKNCI